MATLLLLRHAQAQAAAKFDFDRELTPYGRSQCEVVAEHLLTHELLPDVVLCSAAARTKETWSLVLGMLKRTISGYAPVVRENEELYQATPKLVRSLIREQGAKAEVVLVVGHEPIMSMTAGAMADETSDRIAALSVQTGMPTAGVAVINLASWADSTGTLTDLLRS